MQPREQRLSHPALLQEENTKTHLSLLDYGRKTDCVEKGLATNHFRKGYYYVKLGFGIFFLSSEGCCKSSAQISFFFFLVN